MSGPDRIWAKGNTIDYDLTRWSTSRWNGDTEYIRADLVQYLIQAAQDLDRQFYDNDLGPSALAMGKLREAYMRLK